MRLSNWKENAAFAGGVLGITLMFVLFVEGPIRKKRRQAEQDLNATRQALSNFPEHVQEVMGLNEKIERAESYLERTDNLVPSEENVHHVLELVTELGRRADLDISRLEPVAAVPLETYHMLPFRLTARGSYNGVTQFCHALENGDRLFAVEEMTLTGGDGKNEGDVEIEVIFVSYVDRSVQ